MRTRIVAAVLAGLLLPAGCASAPGTPSPTATAVTVVTPTASSPLSTPASPAYPSDYHAAILTAWSSGDTARLAQLMQDPAPVNAIPGHPDMHWNKINCSGAAGTTGCVYYNNDGDQVVIGVDNEKFGQHQYHAGRLLAWDPITFPSSPKSYADKFLHAWIEGNKAREKLLSSTAVTAHFDALAKIDFSYTLSADGAAGHTHVRITHTGGFDQTISVANELAATGKAHAIDGCLGC